MLLQVLGLFFFFQAEDGIRDGRVTGVQTCALPISSSSRTLPPLASSFARCTRLRSPPERSPTRFCWSPPLKLNHDTYWREFTSRLPRTMLSAPPLISFQTVFAGTRSARDWST